MTSHSILFILPHPTFGGAERLVASITRRLAACGVESHLVVATSDARLPDSSDAWFADHCAIHPVWGAADPAREVIDLMARTGATAVVLCGRSGAHEWLPRIAGARPDIRFVGFQFNAVECIAENRRAAPYLDVLIAESEHAAAALDPGHRLALPVHIISSAVDTAKIAARALPPRTELHPCVAFVGRFDKAKNPAGFVRMAALLPRDGAHLVMAGDGPRMNETRAVARSLGLADRIDWRGLLSDADLENQLDRVDILVVPSLIDGRPLLIQEAQARGTAVVATRTGAIPDLIEDGVTGFLCQPNDHAEIARKVSTLLRDGALRHLIGQEARRRLLRDNRFEAALASYAGAITGDAAILAAEPIFF